jgi:hypothetical protein
MSEATLTKIQADVRTFRLTFQLKFYSIYTYLHIVIITKNGSYIARSKLIKMHLPLIP